MIGVKLSLLPTFCDLGDEVSGRVSAWECLANPVYIFVPRVGSHLFTGGANNGNNENPGSSTRRRSFFLGWSLMIQHAQCLCRYTFKRSPSVVLFWQTSERVPARSSPKSRQPRRQGTPPKTTELKFPVRFVVMTGPFID